MSNDSCNLLRRSTLGIDVESSELFTKSTEKINHSQHYFDAEEIFHYIYNQKTLVFDFSENKQHSNSNFSKLKIKERYNNIDYIHEKAASNEYFTYSKFEKDLFKMFNTVIKTRCLSKSACNYVNYQITQYLKLVKSKKLPSTYLVLKLQDLNNIFTQEAHYKIETSVWPIIPKSFRHYKTIESYEPVNPNQDVKADLKAYNFPTKCPDNCCCFSFETLGDFSYEQSTWISNCPNRKEKMECDENSHNGICKNMGIGRKQRKILGEDVEERLSWGIDIYTRKNIFWVLPDSRDEIDKKFDFIQNKLMKAINLQAITINY